MALADDIRSTFVTSLGDKGQPTVIRRKVAGTYNAATGGVSLETTVDVPGTGWWAAYDDTLINQTTVLSSDRKLIFIATNIAGFSPAPGDGAIAAGKDFHVVRFKTIELSGVLIAHVFQVRSV
jgi:hypothetical protein